jgi:hypothetical protein
MENVSYKGESGAEVLAESLRFVKPINKNIVYISPSKNGIFRVPDFKGVVNNAVCGLSLKDSVICGVDYSVKQINLNFSQCNCDFEDKKLSKGNIIEILKSTVGVVSSFLQKNIWQGTEKDTYFDGFVEQIEKDNNVVKFYFEKSDIESKIEFLLDKALNEIPNEHLSFVVSKDIYIKQKSILGDKPYVSWEHLEKGTVIAYDSRTFVFGVDLDEALFEITLNKDTVDVDIDFRANVGYSKPNEIIYATFK